MADRKNRGSHSTLDASRPAPGTYGGSRSVLKSITVVGGGLAGLALGIALRQRGVPVSLCEAGHYPRHRVCGEFISGRGLEVLARLGLRERFAAAGARRAVTAAFYSATNDSRTWQLPAPALCLSRYVMDELLAREFQRQGGDLCEGEPWRESDFGEGVVRATGRRLHPVENGWRWFGVKAHAHGVALTGDLEMHVSPSAYVGLCRLSGEEVNVCALVRRRTDADDPAPAGRAWLHGAPGTPLHQRLRQAEFNESSFCAVAGLSLRPVPAVLHTECCIGDAITMIPPVTGNGMSIAFESAEIAAEPLAAYSRGEVPWVQAQQRIARQCDATFGRRLAWARWLQRMMFAQGLWGALTLWVSRSNGFWRMTFSRTR